MQTNSPIKPAEQIVVEKGLFYKPFFLAPAQQIFAERAVRFDELAAEEGGDWSNYLRLLAWAFTLFSSVRILGYLPTAWAILASGSSQQHSLLTWAIWTSSNMTMAAWLYEDNGRRLNRAIVVNIGNALMCLVILALVAFYRH